MRKILPLLVVGFLVLGGLGAVATPDENIDYEKMSIAFSNPVVKEEDNDYVTISINEANSYLMIQNKPMLPSYSHTFTFSFGTKIKSVACTPKNIQQQTISKEIMPAPEPVPVSSEDMTNSASDNLEYTTDEDQKSTDTDTKSYPDTWYNYDVRCGLNGNERCVFVNVQVYPIKYHSADSTIEWASNVDITVNYKEPDQPVVFDDEYSFIILTADGYNNKLENLLTHKVSRGISTKRVTLSEIYGGTHFSVQGRDNPEKIKYFIKNAIENWGTSYVMLVGNRDTFPTRDTHIKVSSHDKEVFVSDLYYADIYDGEGGFSSWDTNGNNNFAEYDWSDTDDEMDLSPDVHLGRLAVNNDGELNTCINKINTYETSKAYTKNWFTNMIVIGGDSFPGDKNEVLEGEIVNEAVIDIMGGFIPEKLWVSNGILDSILPSGVTLINNAINEGCGFIDFSGHGNTNIWATHPHEDDSKWLPTPYGRYLSSNIKSTTNGDKLPIVITGACSVSKFSKDKNSFSWSFLSNSKGGGIGSFGATGLGYAYLGEDVTEGLVEGMSLATFEAYKDGAITLGEMWSRALNGYMDSHTINRGSEYKTVLEWELFGDPSLAVGAESTPPLKPSKPNGPSQGSINKEITYSASTTDPDGDQISYLFDWGDGKFSGWVGPYDSGQIGEASHKWTSQGNYEIRVKAKDIHGVQSEWSDPLPISMPKNKDNNDKEDSTDSQLSRFIERVIRGSTDESGNQQSSLLGQILQNVFGRPSNTQTPTTTPMFPIIRELLLRLR